MGEVEDKAKSLDIKGAIAAMIISAFGFIAALFWRDAIQELIDTLVPKGEGLFYSFIAAVVVTVIAVIVIWLMTKYATVSVRIEKRVRKTVESRVKTIKPAHTK